MIIFEKPAQPFTADNVPGLLAVWSNYWAEHENK